MKEKDFIIKNKLGLHARAAAQLVKLANKFTSDIRIIKDGIEANGKSIMGILTLAASQGSVLKIRAKGGDEKSAVDALGNLIEIKFGEEE